MFKSKILRVRPTSKRGVSGKNGLVLVFKIETIEEEVTRTFNQPNSTRSQKSFLYQLLKDLKIEIPESTVITSPYLLAAYIGKMTSNLELLIEVKESGNPKYPWNITKIQLSNIHTEK